MADLFYNKLPLPLPMDIRYLKDRHTADVMATLNASGVKIGAPMTLLTIALLELPEDWRENHSIFEDVDNASAIEKISTLIDEPKTLQTPLGNGSFAFSSVGDSEPITGVYHQIRHANGSLTAALFIDDSIVDYEGENWERQIDERLVDGTAGDGAPEVNEDS